MCGRFTLYTDYEEIFRRYEIEHTLNFIFHKSYNVAPSNDVVAIIHDGAKNRAGLLRWGLIPSWAKDPSIGNKMINARSESLMEKPAFKTLVQRKRCIIPANGFYEWKQEGKRKQPMYITVSDQEIISFAGLYDIWVDAQGKRISTCTIITTKANDLMSTFHERMPVILDQENEKIWLNRRNEQIEPLLSLLQPYPSEKMTAYPVSPEVGNVKNNHSKLIEPLLSS